MSATTVDRPTTVARHALWGAIGGALWALWPVAWAVADVRFQKPGTVAFVAVLGSFWAVSVLGPALVVVGHTALRSTLGSDAHSTGVIGIALASTGFAAAAVGNGIELASLSAGGDTVAAGYVVFYVGSLVAFAGSLLVGITVLRRFRDAASRVAGWLLVLALPLGIGLGALIFLIDPEEEAGFAASVSVATGVAWLLLGRSLSAAHRARAPLPSTLA